MNNSCNSMEFHGTLWNSMDSPWSSMELHGHSMELHGTPWNSMDTPWNSMELHGTPWTLHGHSMEFPWSSMEFHGTPWNSIELEFHGGISHENRDSVIFNYMTLQIVIFFIHFNLFQFSSPVPSFVCFESAVFMFSSGKLTLLIL